MPEAINIIYPEPPDNNGDQIIKTLPIVFQMCFGSIECGEIPAMRGKITIHRNRMIVLKNLVACNACIPAYTGHKNQEKRCQGDEYIFQYSLFHHYYSSPL